MSMPEHQQRLGSDHVSRSASIVTVADAVAYMGTCKKCPRPVRVDLPGYDLSLMDRHVEIRCPDCATPTKGERMYAVASMMTCDESCMHAYGRQCTCGCKGMDHAKIWAQPLRDNELLEAQLSKWRDHMETVDLARKHREAMKDIAEEARRAAPARSGDYTALLDMIRTREPSDDLAAIMGRVIKAAGMTAGEVEDTIVTLRGMKKR